MPSAGRAHHTGKLTVEITTQQQEAIALRKAGYTLAEIGAAMGVTKERIWFVIDSAMQEYRDDIKRGLDELRAIEIARLDRMLQAVWKAAAGGDLQSVDRVLRISERRARLLGLDAPVKIAQTDPTGDQTYGVLVVPAAMTADAWNARAAEMRQKSIESTAERVPDEAQQP